MNPVIYHVGYPSILVNFPPHMDCSVMAALSNINSNQDYLIPHLYAHPSCLLSERFAMPQPPVLLPQTLCFSPVHSSDSAASFLLGTPSSHSIPPTPSLFTSLGFSEFQPPPPPPPPMLEASPPRSLQELDAILSNIEFFGDHCPLVHRCCSVRSTPPPLCGSNLPDLLSDAVVSVEGGVQFDSRTIEYLDSPSVIAPSPPFSLIIKRKGKRKKTEVMLLQLSSSLEAVPITHGASASTQVGVTTSSLSASASAVASDKATATDGASSAYAASFSDAIAASSVHCLPNSTSISSGFSCSKVTPLTWLAVRGVQTSPCKQVAK